MMIEAFHFACETLLITSTDGYPFTEHLCLRDGQTMPEDHSSLEDAGGAPGTGTSKVIKKSKGKKEKIDSPSKDCSNDDEDLLDDEDEEKEACVLKKRRVRKGREMRNMNEEKEKGKEVVEVW